MKLLGEAPQHYINKINADQQPWYLRPNYDQSEILIDPDGGVRAGSKPALIERLTAHETAGELSSCSTTAREGSHSELQITHSANTS